jgi:hypothetical protein
MNTLAVIRPKLNNSAYIASGVVPVISSSGKPGR